MDISQHLLDIGQNSIEAGATTIVIRTENRKNHFSIIVTDNGRGIEDIDEALKKGYTTKNSASSGMGLYLLKKAASRVEIESEINKGTIVKTLFNKNSIAVGDIEKTIQALKIFIEVDYENT